MIPFSLWHGSWENSFISISPLLWCPLNHIPYKKADMSRGVDLVPSLWGVIVCASLNYGFTKIQKYENTKIRKYENSKIWKYENKKIQKQKYKNTKKKEKENGWQSSSVVRVLLLWGVIVQLYVCVSPNHTWYLSRTPRTCSCKSFLAGVNFYRFTAKNWQFTVYFAVLTQKIGNFLCILS